ncbi:MAG: hypothetical protein JWP08_4565, partial [Bryobacterales bacterium]|nr:hypothetical protein [Bryobacterales bacterium]
MGTPFRVLSRLAGSPTRGDDPAMMTMYTTTWCGFCARLKSGLQREGIEW